MSEFKTIEEWKKINKDERKNHPIKYFFKDYYWAFFRFLRNTKWWFLHRTFYRFHVLNLKLEPGYYDIDIRLLYACFSLLEDFMEKEKPGETIDWSYDEEHKNAWKEMNDLYLWWKNRKNSEIKKIEFSGKFDKSKNEEENIKDIFKTFKLEEEDYETCTNNMVRLCKIRKFLWT